MCVLNSDWSAVQTPTARFGRPIETESARLVSHLQKKWQCQTETHPAGDSDRDRSRYMFENVLILLSRQSITRGLCNETRHAFHVLADQWSYLLYSHYYFPLLLFFFSKLTCADLILNLFLWWQLLIYFSKLKHS